MLKEPDQPVPRHVVEEAANVGIDQPFGPTPFDPDHKRVQRIVRPSPGPEPIAEPRELRFVNRRKDRLRHRLLDDLVLQSGNAERSSAAIRLGYVNPPRWRRSIRSGVYAIMQVGQPAFQTLCVLSPRQAIDADPPRSSSMRRTPSAVRRP